MRADQSPIVYDESKPRAHYEAAAELKKKTFRILNAGRILPIFSFLAGLPCIMFEPRSMALFGFFGLLFSILAVIGCWVRQPRMCLISIPLGFVAAMVLLTSKSDFSVFGAAVNFIAAAVQIRAVSAVSDFYRLKELPGFPFFDAGMENITFAALDRRDADEFIDESRLYAESERTERARYLPTEPPSEEMQEIFTEGAIAADSETPALNAFERDTAEAVKNAPEEVRDEVILHLGHLAPNLADRKTTEETGKPKSPYEQMINAQVKNHEEISDIELFG